MPRSPDPVTRAAMLTAAAMVAQQVAARATRDALFLSRFDVTRLPLALAAAALLAMLLAALLTRAMRARGPARVVPAAFALSAALTLVEWLLAARAPSVIAVVVFLHVSALGTVLASGFWSQMNEAFDPRSARQAIGAIGGAGTLGGIAGGVLAERLAMHVSAFGVLPVLGALHLGCAFAARGLTPAARTVAPDDSVSRSGLRVFFETTLLRDIALLTVTLSVGAVLLDYVFKARAAAAFPREQDLLRMFSAFYAAIALLTFLVQVGLSRRFLEGAGLGRTVSALPIGMVGGGAAALLIPGLASAALARGIEAVLRSSLFRSGYELLFTPLPPADRRATKTLVDVGFDRLGDMLGGGAAALCLLLSPAVSREAMLAASVALAVVAVAIALRLQRSYVGALERGLLHGALALDADQVRDRTTRDTMVLTLGSRGVDVTALRAAWKAAPAMTPDPVTPRPTLWVDDRPRPSAPVAGHVPATPTPREVAGGTAAPTPGVLGAPSPADPLLDRIGALRASDAARARAALSTAPLDPSLAPHAIALLGREPTAAAALDALRRAAPRVTGQLVDALLDPETDFAVRRRLPRALAVCDSDRAVDGLLRGLEDVRFEVRYHCGRALTRIHRRDPARGFDAPRVFAAVVNEARLEREWRDVERAQEVDPAARGGSALDAALRARERQSLEHAFELLALVLSPEPLRVALRAIESGDAVLRGTALEYLETTLPAEVRAALWPALEARGPAARPPRAGASALDELMRSSVALRIEAPGAGEAGGRDDV